MDTAWPAQQNIGTLEDFMICSTLLIAEASLPLSQSLHTQLVVHASDAARVWRIHISRIHYIIGFEYDMREG